MSETLKERVRAYWQAEPCGTSTSAAEPGTAEFYADVERRRYELEPFIPAFAQFERWHGKRVLEVGVGLGTDFVQFVRAGAVATGVDLTEASIEAVRERLALEGLEAELRVADAESLPFADAEFELAYSLGRAPSHAGHQPGARRAAPGAHAGRRGEGDALFAALLGRPRGVAALRPAPRRPWQTPTDLLARWMESPGTKAYTQAELDRALRRLLRGALRAVRDAVRPARRWPARGHAAEPFRLVRRDHCRSARRARLVERAWASRLGFPVEERRHGDPGEDGGVAQRERRGRSCGAVIGDEHEAECEHERDATRPDARAAGGDARSRPGTATAQPPRRAAKTEGSMIWRTRVDSANVSP